MSEKKENMSGIEMLQRLKQRVEHEGIEQENDENVKKQIKDSYEKDLERTDNNNNRNTMTMPDLSTKDNDRRTVAMPGLDIDAKGRATEVMLDLGENDKNRKTETMPTITQTVENIDDKNTKKIESEDRIAGFNLSNINGDRHYLQVGKRIGHGGTADIYKVFCQETKEYYAVKIYREDYINDHIDELYEEFKGEFVDGLISIIDFGVWENEDCIRKFYVLPYYSEMMNLKEYLNEYDMTDEQIVSFVSKISNALHALHVKGFYHRDVKPENILYDKKLDTPILIDYGSVTKGDLSIGETTVTTNVQKTDGYTAPEIYLWYSLSAGQEVQANEKTDFFALGAVLGDIFKSMQNRGQGDDTRLFRNDKDACFSSQSNKFCFPEKLVENEKMVNLVHALLLYMPEKRAGYKEVLQWLEGKELDIDQTNYSKNVGFEYTFGGTKYDSEIMLARGLAENWERALKEVNRGELLNRFRSMSNDYKDKADSIADIEEYYQKNIKDKNIRDDGMLLEIIERLGTNLPFVWKGKVYETTDGNTDIETLIEDIYEDAFTGGNKFDSLVLTRAVKELLYPQIRFVNDDSSELDKESVDYNSRMSDVLAINQMAKQSVSLAKFYTIEKCCSGFLINKLSMGKTKDTNEYLKTIVTSENFDEAMQYIYDGILQERQVMIKFLHDYMKRDEIRAILMSSYDVNVVPKIREDEERANALLKLMDLLLKIKCQNNKIAHPTTKMTVDIAAVLNESNYIKSIFKFADAATRWEYKDYMEAKVAENMKKIIKKYAIIFSDVLQEFKEHGDIDIIFTRERGEEKIDIVLMVGEFALILEEAKKMFVSDKALLSSGLVYVTSKNLYSSIVAKDEDSSLCLVDGRYVVTKEIAEEIYAPLGLKISEPEPQDEIRNLSIVACEQQVQRFYNNFKSLVGNDTNQIMKYKKIRLICDFVIATIVVLCGIGLILSGFSIVKSEVYQSELIHKVYANIILIMDIVIGGILVLGCYSNWIDAWFNLRLYKKNQKLVKYFRIVESTTTTLNSMKKSNHLCKLTDGENEVVELASSVGNGAKTYFEKYKLNSFSGNYRISTIGSMLFVGIIGLLIFLYSNIPARNVLGAMLADEVCVAAEYAKKAENLPFVIKKVNNSISKVSLELTEENAERALINKYNKEKLTEEEFNKAKDLYMSMCREMGCSIDESLEKALTMIVDSKKAFEQGKKLNEKGKIKKSMSMFLNVIEEDSNYDEAEEYLTKYLKNTYWDQQYYIEHNDQEKLDKLIKKYAELLENNVNGSMLKDMYDILSSDYDIQEKARRLVAYQMYRNAEKWIDNDICRISCVKSSVGEDYVCVQKKNTGLKRLFNKYLSSVYVVNTYSCSLDNSYLGLQKYEMQKFEPDFNMETYLELLDE